MPHPSRERERTASPLTSALHGIVELPRVWQEDWTVVLGAGPTGAGRPVVASSSLGGNRPGVTIEVVAPLDGDAGREMMRYETSLRPVPGLQGGQIWL